MKQAQRDELFDLLRGPAMIGETAEDQKVLDTMIAEDIARVEPWVDALLKNQFEELREKMVCGHRKIDLELADLAEQQRFQLQPGVFLLDTHKMVYVCSACVEEGKKHESVR